MMRKRSSPFRSVALLAFIFLTTSLFSSALFAQQTAPDPLPDSPGTVVTADSSSNDGQSAAPGQTPTTPQQAGNNQAPPKRLFYIIPNFRNVSTTTVLPPQSAKDKFVDATQDTFDYSAVILEVALATYSYETNGTPEFGSGPVGYGRYFWHTAADQSIENYMVEFIVPTIAHEDTRYYTLGSGGFTRRAEHSLGQVFITKSDSGKRTFNSGEILGAAAASGISEYYYPGKERSVDNWAGKYATNLIIDAGSYFVREFYPEISRTVFHQKTLPPQ
jgi:hypothetical protein